MASIVAAAKQVAGKHIADGNVIATGKAQKKIIQDCLAGENDRKKVESWPPNYVAVPFKPYTRNGSIRVEQAWSKVKSLFKAT